ncbi:MAG TPA: HAMP domain-containing sensor histidine kinase [Micromonosporaceae bacterium]|nr:HAMP domain-containing sensor histidine kinase [Micromonosporaceae bacterium]
MIAFIRRHWTIRVRLTAVYSGLFFLAGGVLLLVTYLLMAERLDRVGPRMEGGAVVFDAGRPPNVDPDTLDQIRERIFVERERVRNDALNSLLTQGGIALGVVGIASIGAGWLLAGRALRPVQQITETAGRIVAAPEADRHLHERIALRGPQDEIKRLADTFDDMLERLDRSFDGQRRFVANASHELRTPLAINRTLLEVALGRQDASTDLRQLGDTLLEVNGRHERLIDGLLTLARSESAPPGRTPLDLSELTTHVVEQVRADATAAGVEVVATVVPAPTVGDPVLLERLALNLLQNAVQYNARDGWVSVETRVAGSTVELVVANTGPVVTAYEVSGLFEPFRRLNDRVGSAKGTGLGLSIVRSVARAHGGEAVASPREGGGLMVKVTLPSTQN